MNLRLYLAAALSIAAVPGLAAAPFIRQGTPYKAARAELLQRGWLPVKATHPDCEPGREDVCAKYPEAQSCSGTGSGLCTFDFSHRRHGRIEIVTHGGSADHLVVSEVVTCRPSACD